MHGFFAENKQSILRKNVENNLKCSQDTALRDIKDLIEKGMLMQEEKGGRSTNYALRL
jgi:predicted HTH transcriptional regulator